MPTYGTITYKAGFYNSRKNSNGEDDRVYTAEDIRKPYNSIYTKGVKPEADGTAGEMLKVSATGGMGISVSKGEANLGAWFINESAFNITLDNSTGADRYDAVIIQNDDSDAVRMPSIYIKSLSSAPTVADLTRDEKIYEICVAYVRVPALATVITAANIVDTREDGQLCNVMSGVGAMVVRTYHNTYFSETANQTQIPIGIPQYNKARDELSVIINGRVFANGTQYTIDSNSQVTLAIGLPVVGTRIDFEVAKNVNAAGAETVVQEVDALRAEMTAANKILEHHYYCGGVNDNVRVSQIVEAFLSGGTTFDSMRLVIHGHFVATSAVTGTGTSTNPYIWIRAGQGSATNRRCVLDFTDCDQITINCDSGSYNTIFFGLHVDIVGANVAATGGAQITMFSVVAQSFANAEKCRFWITSQAGYIARGGNFRNCRVSLTTDIDNACAFNVLKGGILRLYGGEYYAYAPSGKFSAVVYVNAEQTGAVALTYGICCPTVSRNPYVQTYAVNCLTNDACCSFTDTITTLDIEAAGQNVRGTIARSIAGTL